ncbi:PAS domain-containing protein [Gramella jeungdoensis]|uniref:histidine kinase n=1 Tax=Gramella jeungdoensis TaxID=708091 RepID=A0ABT0Z4I5_9FLAO|nr:PAS domain-containing protein [Gramella jeungdoensis]MCM8570429.1 PAS domain-containing protein [Gramella jeungdoensis]
MNEAKRLEELYNYQILDSCPEQKLTDIAMIASSMVDMPISQITFIDKERQWYKVNLGLDASEIPREFAFCQHALNNPKELLIVDDPENDERFKDNPLVKDEPNIRFYAGAPLESENGYVLGTLCVVDTKRRKLNKNQKRSLKLLAKQVMDYLNMRKTLIIQNQNIQIGALKLVKLTNAAPGTIFQLEHNIDNARSFIFLSEGIKKMFPFLNPKKLSREPELLFNHVHKDDQSIIIKTYYRALSELKIWECQFRILRKDGSFRWYYGRAKPEKMENGNIIWSGTFQDIHQSKEYQQALEDISFDISHVLRKPVTNMLSITSLIEEDRINEETLKRYARLINIIAEELDNFTRNLNGIYQEKRLNMKIQKEVN